MRLGTIQTLHKNFWQWMKNQIAQDVPASDGLCEYDCRKQQCTEEEWVICERRIGRAAGELWPETKPAPTPPQSSAVVDYPSILVSQSEKEQALARLKCAHCQSVFNCEGLAQAVLTELRRCRIESRSVSGGDPEVTDPELIEAVRRGIECFLRDSFGSDENSELCPPCGVTELRIDFIGGPMSVETLSCNTHCTHRGGRLGISVLPMRTVGT